MPPAPLELCTRSFPVRDYDLSATLSSGQAFRWKQDGDRWTGIIGTRWVRLTQESDSLTAEAVGPMENWDWLTDYLQLHVDLRKLLDTFPNDPPMRAAVTACRGLRLLRQDPWECLASFILSSTKRITQIQQVVSTLCQRFGEPVATPEGSEAMFTFPTPERLAKATERELRDCKMGFRAPYLLAAASAVATKQIDLPRVCQMPVEAARAEVMALAGVGRKIANCFLLFAGGVPAAFPLDVWVIKALRHLYFAGRPVASAELQHFAETHFGSHPGYAQQYLFHYIRTKNPKLLEPTVELKPSGSRLHGSARRSNRPERRRVHRSRPDPATTTIP
jgi:N-glycosylase/DNA lyase